jgi:hypothetical protein
MELKSFREFMWNKRRNEYLKLKNTERYQNDPEPSELIYKNAKARERLRGLAVL